jgi:hypothetical protein
MLFRAAEKVAACMRARLATLDQNTPSGDRTMLSRIRSLFAVTAFAAAAAVTATAASAQKKYDPGASDTEIKIGNIMPSPDDFFPIEQMQLMRFNGEAWELFGDVINGEVGH